MDKFSSRFGHVPVLGHEAVQAMAPVDGGAYVDATMGGGGYTRMILGEAGVDVYAFDRDPVAIERAAAWSGAYAGRLTLLPHDFGQMQSVLMQIGVKEVDGVVFDLGVSSVQLDEGDRGFSFRHDGPLNMRMDGAAEFDAQALLAQASEKDLADIIYIYGEEKKSRAIARAIVEARKTQELVSTGQLARLIEATIGKRAHEKIHPATRTFQAIRIFVNDELGQLVKGLLAAEKILRTAGRLAVVTFHSLEDRIVKRFLAQRSGQGQGGSRHMPMLAQSYGNTFSLLQTKAIVPSQEEIDQNPRARSARLRVGVRANSTAPMPSPEFYKAIGLPQLSLSPALYKWSHIL